MTSVRSRRPPSNGNRQNTNKTRGKTLVKTSFSTHQADRRSLKCSILLIATALVLVIFCLKFFFTADSPTTHRDAAHLAIGRNDYPAAVESAQRQLLQTPGDEASLLIGAEAAERGEDPALALTFLDQLPPKFDNAQQIQAWRSKARILKRLGRVTDSCSVLQTILEHVPDELIARRWLCQTLSECGFEFQAVQQASVLLQQRSAELFELALLARNGRGRISGNQLDRLLNFNPDDEMPLIGLLRLAERRRNAVQIQFLLDDADARIPEPSQRLQCWQLALALISDSADVRTDEITNRVHRIHERPVASPAAWLVTAEWAQKTDRSELHQACLVSAVRMDRWNSAAIHALANSLRLHESPLADRFFDLFRRLQNIERLATQAEVSPQDADRISVLATELTEIGRTAEARAWTKLAQEPPLTNWTHPIDDLADVDVDQILKEQLLATPRTPQKLVADAVQLNDIAAAVGLNFQYNNGRSSEQQGLKMHQWTGGGVGVVDFDGDSWPDLYLTQGGELDQRVQTGPNEGDALYRNRRGQSFAPAELAAGLDETRYGQGVAVGDVNQDGFDDIYVANVGVNRLLTNQGDGTFIATDMTPGGEVWTTSVAIADLNQDAVPDLYDVNYLRGADVFTKTCDHSGLQRICGPTDFSAEADRLLLADAAGGYSAAPDFPVGTEGRGMGLLVGALVGKFSTGTGNQIYVANDESANQLFVTDPNDNRADGFHEIAATVGVAFDLYGQSQGSMGIASGDIDHDGLLDLFVTNYYAEQNTFYRQQAASFSDATSPVGLAGPGYAQLGFGCQFLDIQNDGRLDVIVANGHLDDFTHEGQPYRMLPQIFLNTADGVFQHVQPRSAFFRTPALGRAVATLDWDGEGRCDFVVGHLDRPIALISNQTPALNPTVTIQLVGTTSPRIPIGAVVEADTSAETLATVNQTGPTQQTRWLTAGDGYQSSNERVVRFAVQGQSARWTVKWPDGRQQPVSESAAGTHCLIQGRAMTYILPR